MNNIKDILRELHESDSAYMYIAGIIFVAVIALALVAHLIKAIFFSGWASFLFWSGSALIFVGIELISDAIKQSKNK